MPTPICTRCNTPQDVSYCPEGRDRSTCEFEPIPLEPCKVVATNRHVQARYGRSQFVSSIYAYMSWAIARPDFYGDALTTRSAYDANLVWC